MGSFLENVTITANDRTKLLPMLSNWMNLFENIFPTNDEEMILKLIKLETMTKGRVQIIYRLKSRFNALRNQREMSEILKELVE